MVTLLVVLVFVGAVGGFLAGLLGIGLDQEVLACLRYPIRLALSTLL